jgi:hypothetical protein
VLFVRPLRPTPTASSTRSSASSPSRAESSTTSCAPPGVVTLHPPLDASGVGPTVSVPSGWIHTVSVDALTSTPSSLASQPCGGAVGLARAAGDEPHEALFPSFLAEVERPPCQVVEVLGGPSVEDTGRVKSVVKLKQDDPHTIGQIPWPFPDFRKVSEET